VTLLVFEFLKSSEIEMASTCGYRIIGILILKLNPDSAHLQTYIVVCGKRRKRQKRFSRSLQSKQVLTGNIAFNPGMRMLVGLAFQVWLAFAMDLHDIALQ
jgi:hypothetical protein